MSALLSSYGYEDRQSAYEYRGMLEDRYEARQVMIGRFAEAPMNCCRCGAGWHKVDVLNMDFGAECTPCKEWLTFLAL